MFVKQGIFAALLSEEDMRKKIVAGNWKMNGNSSSIKCLVHEVSLGLGQIDNVGCILLPPTIYVPLVRDLIKDTKISLGAQNMFPKEEGAFTGEVSALMLKDNCCDYVLVGHSERRILFHEDEKFIAEKFHHAKEHGIIPILCIGETLAERQEGQTKEVLARQISAVYKKSENAFENSIVAYEPVWAIGTGLTPEPNEVQEVHAYIRELIASKNKEAAEKVSILYGGSVNKKNAHSILSMSNVDGGLVGGASLNAAQFVEIVQCIN